MNRRSFLKAALATAVIGPSLLSAPKRQMSREDIYALIKTRTDAAKKALVDDLDKAFMKAWSGIREQAIQNILAPHPLFDWIEVSYEVSRHRAA